MRLTIVPSDSAVYIDEVMYSSLGMASVPDNVHALQWFDVDGWIEYKSNDVPNEQITELPSWVQSCIQEWQAADNEHKQPKPITIDDNKNTATALLSETDWTALPDVADPAKSSPYLANVSDFNAYRNAVRQIAINPVAGNIDWPAKPNADWRASE